MAEPDFASSPSGNVAEKYPPAGGMGDWGLPQQARLSYKRYACVNAAIGGVGLVPSNPCCWPKPVSKGQKESVKTWIFAPTELISLPPKHAYIYSSFPRTIDFLKDTDIIKLTIKTETRVRTLVPQDSPVGQFPSAIFL